MRLLDLLPFERFRLDNSVKVLRHHARLLDLWELRDNGSFHTYQNDQSWDVFGNAKHVISFISERNRYAKFVGVWTVVSKHKKVGKGYTYRTKEVAGFKDLERRLVVRWGEGTRSWGQWLHRQGNKEIAELLPPNYVMDFPGFYNFALSFDQLRRMVNDPDSNREWVRMLSSVSAVYALLDRRSGRQYIGSAYGAGGLWARWKSYIKSPSGGNAQLVALFERKPDRFKSLQFSILRVLEPHATQDEVISQEVLTKRKLGSRAFGLNSN